MAATVLADAERIVSAYLRSVPSLDALVGDRIYTEIPRRETDRVFPLVVLSRVGGGPTGSPHFLDRVLLSVSVWGGTKYEARQIAATIQAEIDEISGYSAHGGYATGASPGALRYELDDSFEKPKPRYLLDSVVFVRPSP